MPETEGASLGGGSPLFYPDLSCPKVKDPPGWGPVPLRAGVLGVSQDFCTHNQVFPGR